MSKKKSVKGDPLKPIYHFFPKAVTQNVSSKDFYTQNLPKAITNDTSVNSSANQLSTDGSGVTLPMCNCQNANEDQVSENTKLRSQLNEANEEIERLRIENKKIQNDLASMKKLYNQTCRSYVQKDFKIKLLEKQNEKENCFKRESNLIYDQYEQILGTETLKDLRSVNGTKRNDSKFILLCMRKLYTDPEKLRFKTASGIGKVNSVISPDKRQILESMLVERLSNQQIDEGEFNTRYRRLNDLVNIAINNIRRAVSNYIFIV